MNLAADKQEAAPTGPALRRLLRTLDGLWPASPSFRVRAGERISGKFYGATLTTALQPLRQPASGKIRAYEALARSYSAAGAGLSPWGLFAGPSNDAHLIALDRICRTIHALNFRASGLADSDAALVLNVHERLLRGVPKAHGAFFREVLDLIELPPERIVIDLPALRLFDIHWLRRIVGNYRHTGFRVALEAASTVQAKLFGTMVRPDWIRLAPALADPETVGALHALGVTVVATRVEDAASHAQALAAGVDLTQGFHTDIPSENF